MLKQELLHSLESGFSYHTLSELQRICGSYLTEDKHADNLFVYIINNICFQVGEHLDALEPITVELHKGIENTIKDSLIASITCLGTDDLDEQIALFNDLISAYQKAKKLR
jgi:hypothetical protein